MDKEILLEAYSHMCAARAMANIYDANRPITRYVHSTSRGHEAIQLAVGMQLTGIDYATPYYRDESMLLAMGMSPYELMLQLLAKAEDPFSGGRTYYSHPNLKRDGFVKMPHQSSATGMQAIPATGMAHGIAYLESQGLIKSQFVFKVYVYLKGYTKKIQAGTYDINTGMNIPEVVGVLISGKVKKYVITPFERTHNIEKAFGFTVL